MPDSLCTSALDLKPVYDKVQLNGSVPSPLEPTAVVQRLRVRGYMLGALQSLYDGSLLYPRIDGQRRRPSIGLRHGCPLSAMGGLCIMDDLHHDLQPLLQLLQCRSGISGCQCMLMTSASWPAA